MISKQLDDQKPRIIIVGSPAGDGGIIKSLSRQLYDMDQASTAQDLNACLSVGKYDLVILDINVSDADNVSLIQMISSRSKSYYLLVRSETDDQLDTVLALELGADDCVCLSCSPREIKARVRALLRRRKNYVQSETEASDEQTTVPELEFSHDGWILRGDRCQLLTPAGNVIPLTKAESTILVSLFSDPGIIKDRSELLGINTNSKECDIRSLNVYVSRLRKKIASYDCYDIIKTVQGRGYRLNTTMRPIG